MIFVYEFTDRTIYKLLDVGFCANDIWSLEKIHGKLIRQCIKER